jgi:Na+/proline symporter
MELSFFIALVATLFAVVFLAAKLISSKPLGWFSLVASFIASQIGSSLLIYTAEYAYTDGFLAIMYPLGTCLGMLLLSFGVGAKIHKLQINDLSDVFKKHYHSEFLKRVSSFLLLASFLGLLVAQAVALKGLLEAMGIAHESFFITMWMAMLVFTVYGTVKSAFWTEALQAILILGMLGAAYLLQTASEPHQEVLWQRASFFSFKELNPNLLSALLLPCFFVIIDPEAVKNIPVARSKRKIWSAALCAALLVVGISLPSVYCGIAGNKSMLLSEEVNLSPSALGSHTKLATFCTCLLLVAFICSLSSTLQSLHSKIKDISLSRHARPSWKWTFVLGIGALVGSYTTTSMSSLLLDSYGLIVSCFLVPVVKAAFARNAEPISKYAAALSMVCGASTFCLCHIFSITSFPEILSIGISWVGFIIGQQVVSHEKVSERS